MTLFEEITQDFHPEWDDNATVDAVNAKFAKPEEYNDSEGSDGYSIKPPYIFTSADGKELQADYIEPFHNGFAVVKMCTSEHPNGTYNYIGKDGKAISDEGFKSANDFECGLGLVKRMNGMANYIKPDGTFLLKGDVSRASDFMNGEAKYIESGMLHTIDTNGNIIS